MTGKLGEHGVEVREVFGNGLGVYHNVIQVHADEVHVLEEPVHHPLESGGCVHQDEGHHLELIFTVLSDEFCLVFACLVHHNLPKTAEEVYS